mmetsp:Transcript_1922/g.4498  ORF Transcript_1922/g.4498 Transcript_1922/m.4498 type:complete len:205 (-) Transcript_1922:556-1170(-)
MTRATATDMQCTPPTPNLSSAATHPKRPARQGLPEVRPNPRCQTLLQDPRGQPGQTDPRPRRPGGRWALGDPALPVIPQGQEGPSAQQRPRPGAPAAPAAQTAHPRRPARAAHPARGSPCRRAAPSPPGARHARRVPEHPGNRWGPWSRDRPAALPGQACPERRPCPGFHLARMGRAASRAWRGGPSCRPPPAQGQPWRGRGLR